MGNLGLRESPTYTHFEKALPTRALGPGLSHVQLLHHLHHLHVHHQPRSAMRLKLVEYALAWPPARLVRLIPSGVHPSAVGFH